MSNEMTSIVELSAQELDAVAGGANLNVDRSKVLLSEVNLHKDANATFDQDKIVGSIFNVS